MTVQGWYQGEWKETLEGVCASQVVTDPSDSRWIGAVYEDNVDAELSAAFVAVAFALSLFLDVQIVLRPDLRFSCELVDGLVAPRVDRPLTGLVASLGRVARSKGLLATMRVQAHEGHEWNELADTLAKFAASHGMLGCPNFAWTHELATRPTELQWWPYLLGHVNCQAWPAVQNNQLMIGSVGKPTCAELEVVPESDRRAMQLQMRVLTYNVLSLAGDEAFDQLGRRGGHKSDRLDAQFQQRGIILAGLQEARTDPGVSYTEHYKIFSAGASLEGQSKHHGCELWVHRSKSWVRGAEIGFQQTNFAVVHQEPRLLAVRADNTTGHAPYWKNAESSELLKAWWCKLRQAIARAPPEAVVLLFVDANAVVGQHTSDLIGGYGAQPGNGATQPFVDFLHDVRLACPTTFENVHVGPQGTWRHPNGSWRRIDYITLSERHAALGQKSDCWMNFDSGYARDDHVPVVLELGGWMDGQEQHPMKIDRQQCEVPQKVCLFQQELAKLPTPAWHVDVDFHAAWYRKQVRRIAEQVFAPEPGKTKPAWMSAETQTLVSWKRCMLECSRRNENVHWATMLREELREIEKQVRKACRVDRKAFFHSLVVDLDKEGLAGNFKAVFSSLCRLGRKKKNAATAKILPMLRKADGEIAESYAQQQQVWFDKFAKVEAAQVVTECSLQDRHQCIEGSAVNVHLDDLPTFAEVQRKVRKLRKGKATGPDQICNELLKAGGDQMCARLHEMLVKTVCAGREPLQWKAGRAVPLYKKGAVSNPDNYRSIFLSNSIAKLHHSLLRDRLCATYEKVASKACFGGRKGCGTDMGHYMLQSLLSLAEHSAISSAFVFLDLRAAFYSVIRQGLFGQQMHDEFLCMFLARQGVSPEELEEWDRQAQLDFALEDQSPLVQGWTQDAFKNAHFSMRGVSSIALTSRGTRPGDPIGDICFNIIMQKVLAEVRSRVTY